MNRKKLGLISAMVCLICVILVIFVNVASTRTIHVAGQEVKCRIRNRKLTVEDFEVFELDELNVHVHESDLKKQIGKPDGYLTKEIGEINQVGVGTMFYLLEDGNAVVPFFSNDSVWSLVVYDDGGMLYTIKERYELAPNEIAVAGYWIKCPPEDRKYTVQDFEDVELWDTYNDLLEKVGEASFWTGTGFRGYPIYVLEDGRGVVPHFMNGFIYGLTLWKGDSRECILKAVDESDLKKVHYNGNDIEYVTRHRNLTVADFENIELGTPLSEMVEKIGEQDALSRDSETGNRTMLFVLKDDKVAECYLLYGDEAVSLKKIVIYDGDDIDLVIEDTE